MQKGVILIAGIIIYTESQLSFASWSWYCMILSCGLDPSVSGIGMSYGKAGNFLTIWVTISFSRTLLQRVSYCLKFLVSISLFFPFIVKLMRSHQDNFWSILLFSLLILLKYYVHLTIKDIDIFLNSICLKNEILHFSFKKNYMSL
jgi:hypothetical protein